MKSSSGKRYFRSRKNGLAAGAGPRLLVQSMANRAGAQELRVVVDTIRFSGR